MINRGRVDSQEIQAVTRGTVTRSGFSGCQTDEDAINIMAGCAAVMHLGVGSIHQGRCVAAGTACGPCCHQGSVVRVLMAGKEISGIVAVAGGAFHRSSRYTCSNCALDLDSCTEMTEQAVILMQGIILILVGTCMAGGTAWGCIHVSVGPIIFNMTGGAITAGINQDIIVDC